MNRSKLASPLAFGGAVCALLALACSTTSDAPAPGQPAATMTSVRKEAPGALAESTSVRSTATVVSIDHATRAATLRLQDGRVVRIKAGEQVRNLEQVKAGDEVIATYLESVVIQVRPAGEANPGASAAVAGFRSTPGQMPVGAEVSSVTVVATVQAIDRAKQEVTLETRDGARQGVHVNDPAHFDHVAVGDLVEITFTEALAISVERPVAR